MTDDSFHNEEEEDDECKIKRLENALKSKKTELEKLQEDVKELSQQLATTVPRAQALQLRVELETKIDELTQEKQELTEHIEKEKRERQWIEKELKAQYNTTTDTEKELNELRDTFKKTEQSLKERAHSLQSQKEERETITRSLEELKEEVSRLRKETNSKSRALTRLEEIHKECTNTIKSKDDQLTTMQKDACVARRQYDQLHKELLRQNEKKAELEKQLKSVRGLVRVSTEQAKVKGRQERFAKRQVERITKEKETLQNNLVKAIAQEKKQEGLVNLGDKERQKTQKLLSNVLNDLHAQDKLVVGLQDARDRQLEDTARVEAKLVQVAGEIEVRDREIDSLWTCEAALKEALAQSATVLESVKMEHHQTKRNLQLVQVERDEERERVQASNYLLTQFEDTRKALEQKIKELISDVEIEKTKYQNKLKECAEYKHKITEQQLELENAGNDKQNLKMTCQSLEKDLKNFDQELTKVKCNTSNLESTLVKRNDEIANLQNKVQLLGHILTKGHAEYESRLREIKALTKELMTVRDERDILHHKVSLIDSLKTELVRQQRTLATTRKRQAVLEIEVLNRTKVHPWVSLKASKPNIYELLKKNQYLQKKYLKSTQKITSLESELMEHNEKQQQLQHVVEKTSKDETIKNFTKICLQQQLRDKDDQLKSLTAALNATMFSQEENEQEKKEMKNKIAALTIRVAKLQREKLSTRLVSSAPTSGR